MANKANALCKLLLCAMSTIPVAAFAHDGSHEEGTSVTLTGTLEIKRYDDFTSGRSWATYILRDRSNGGQWELNRGDAALKGLRSGQTVRIQGRARGNQVTVAAAGGSVETLSVTTETTSGAQRTAVIMVNLTDAAIECTAAEVTDLLFTGERTVDGLFQATSFGKLSFNGDVFGPYTINYATTDGCLEDAWAAAAETAATGDGADLSQYVRKVYVLPIAQPCDWSGLATLGGNPSQSWIGVCWMKDLYAHELGHNLYMYHAALDDNNDGINDCEYCDNSDFMGMVPSGWRHTNAPHKEQMDWIPAEKIIEPSGNGSWTLSTLETTPSLAAHPQIVKFLKDSATGDHYYFSYRTLAPNYNDEMDEYYADAVSIHRWRGDTTYFIRTLRDNEVFSDTSINLQVKNVARTTDSVTLEVSRNCQSYAPWTDTSPGICGSNDGTTCSYTVQIWNQDYDCVDTTWYLSTTVPAGWTTKFTPSTLTIPPGGNASATLEVAPPPGTPDGKYDIRVHMNDNIDPNHTEVDLVHYQLGDGEAPSAPTNLSASNSKGTVSLAWTASTDNVGVAGYRIYRNDIEIGQSTTTSYTDTPGRGSWTYYVKAYDAAGNLSAASNSRSLNVR